MSNKSYQDRILRAFQEVEDRLASLRILSQKAQYQATALARAKGTIRLVQDRYRNGLARRVEVDDAQRTWIPHRKSFAWASSTLNRLPPRTGA